MKKIKIWYYTLVKTEDSGGSVYGSFPDEIEHEGKKRIIKLTKDSFETISKELDYGE
jgi:hypothetical protein